MSGGPTIFESKICQEIHRQRNEEMDMMSGQCQRCLRYLHQASYKRNGDDIIDATSPKVKVSPEDVNRIQVSDSKPECLYSVLSDIDSADTDARWLNLDGQTQSQNIASRVIVQSIGTIIMRIHMKKKRTTSLEAIWGVKLCKLSLIIFTDLQCLRRICK